MPPFYHVPGLRRLAQIILFPGWQVVNWLTGGIVSRTFEYKLLMPLIIIGLNVLAWGAVIYSVGNVVESRQRCSSTIERDSHRESKDEG
jgi:hypothetical protein